MFFDKFILWLLLFVVLVSALAQRIKLYSGRRIYYLSAPYVKEPEESEHLQSKYVVSLHRNKAEERYYFFGKHHYCVGTIIGPTFILTAAHCVFDSTNRRLLKPRDILVVAGTSNRLRPTAKTLVLPVKQIYPYSHKRVVPRHDLAMLRLYHALELNLTRYLDIALLPLLPPFPQGNCTVLGWGRALTQHHFSEQLIKRRYSIQSDKYCHQIFNLHYKNGMICAKLEPNETSDLCRGDSGGPLFCNQRLIGIVSRGVRCDKKYPALFTSIFWHQIWIAETAAAGIGLTHGGFAMLLAMFTLYCASYYPSY